MTSVEYENYMLKRLKTIYLEIKRPHMSWKSKTYEPTEYFTAKTVMNWVMTLIYCFYLFLFCFIIIFIMFFILFLLLFYC